MQVSDKLENKPENGENTELSFHLGYRVCSCHCFLLVRPKRVFVHAACFVSLLLFMSARVVHDQCLCTLRVLDADMDWVEGANFLDTSYFLHLRVSSSTFSRHWPIATFRRSFRAEWLIHYFLIFGLPVSVFLTDLDVTAVAQTSGLVRLLLHPLEAITLVPH